MLIDGLDIGSGIKDYRKRLKKIIDTKSALNSIYCVNGIKEVLDDLTDLELKDLILSYIRDEYYKSGSYKIGDKFLDDRYSVEEIYHSNATAYYPSDVDGKKIVMGEGKVERETFYYYDDSGYIYKSYVETLVGVGNKNNPNLPTYLSDVVKDDKVLVEVVGKIAEDEDGDLLFNI